MNEVALHVNGLGKCYVKYSNNFKRFAEWFGIRARREHEYWALKDVSFYLKRGEALAIIGQNGAGKSTILKLITGTVRPTTGTVHVVGSISAILELGLGFNPDFTGRQNVYLAGGLIGLCVGRLSELMPSIEEFAEIGEFFDQPLRVYSSGMQARLAFSVITAIQPEVLIVDEVLSVGDSYFQHKSFDRIRKFKEQGTSIIFVTHSLDAVRSLCERVILLDKGQILKDGLPDEVVDYYNALIAAKENAKLSVEQRREKNGWLLTKSGTGEVRVISLKLVDAATGQELAIAYVGQKVELICETIVYENVPQLVLGFMIRDKRGNVVWGTNTWHTKQVQHDLKSNDRVIFRMPFTCTLGPGSYSVTSALTMDDTHLTNNFEWSDNILVFDVINTNTTVFIGSNWLNFEFFVQKHNGSTGQPDRDLRNANTAIPCGASENVSFDQTA